MTLLFFINILLTMKKNRIIYIPLILSFVLSGCNQTEKKETPIVNPDFRLEPKNIVLN